MSRIQAPISRHLSGNTEMAGKTTMIPQTATAYMMIPEQQQYDIERQYFFRHHALLPRTAQASLGMRGDTDNGHRYEVRGRGDVSMYNPRSFGTPNIKRSMQENIENTVIGDREVLRRTHAGNPPFSEDVYFPLVPQGSGLFKTHAFHEMGRDLKGGAVTRSQSEKAQARKIECAKRAKAMGECRTYKGPDLDLIKSKGSGGWKCKGKRCFVGKGGKVRLGGDPATYTPR